MYFSFLKTVFLFFLKKILVIMKQPCGSCMDILHSKNKHILVRSRSRGVGFMNGSRRPQRQVSFHFRHVQEDLKATWTHGPLAVFLTILYRTITETNDTFFFVFFFFNLHSVAEMPLTLFSSHQSITHLFVAGEKRQNVSAFFLIFSMSWLIL